MNTMFCKKEESLATYQENKSHMGGPPYKRPTHEVLDYVLTPKRWRNAIKYIYSDVSADINSDHYPLVAVIKVRLITKYGQRPNPYFYAKCSEEEQLEFNQQLSGEADEVKDYHGFRTWIRKGAKDTIPKLEKSGNRTTELPKELLGVIEARKKAWEDGDPGAAKTSTQVLRKSVRRDRRKNSWRWYQKT